jgi:AcrR family transcriptional regulator
MNTEQSTNKRHAGRPRAFDREQALHKAMELFWRHGFEGTSTSMLTHAMGISPPSLYAAFGSKEVLYQEAINYYIANYGNFMSKAFAGDTNTRDAVHQMLQNAAVQFAGGTTPKGCMVSTGVLHSAPDVAQVARHLTACRVSAREAILARLQLGQQRGEIPGDAELISLAGYFAATIQGMAIQAQDGASQASLAAIADLAMHAWPE